MGLKKPSSGGGLPSDVVDYSGKQATFAAYTTDYDGTNIRMHSKPTEKTLLDTASTVTATAPLSSFGDATEADVASGKTFTGAAGLFKTGTAAKSDYGFEVLGEIPIPNSSSNTTFNAPDGTTHLLFEDGLGLKTFAPMPSGSSGYTNIRTYNSSGSYKTAYLSTDMSNNPVISGFSGYLVSIKAVKLG